MSKITELENIPDIEIAGSETLEETVAKCRELYAKYDKQINGSMSTLATGSDANLLLLTMAYRFHHQMEYANAWGKMQFLATSTGAGLDNLAPLVGAERMEAGYASCVIRFTLSAARTSATSIPAGTQVRTADKIYFATDAYAEVAAGELTVDVTATAVESGEGSNDIPAGEVNVLVDPIPYVQSAVSVSDTSGGTDVEDDDSFTRRIHYAPSNVSVAGPEDLYEYYASSWRNDVTDEKIVCEEGYTIYIYFLLEDGALPTETECRAMETYFDGIKKPMGDLVVCCAPEEVEYSIDLTYYIASSNMNKATTIQANVEQAVADYMSWQRKIGRDIDPSELIMRVREAGAKRPTLTAPEFVAVSSIQVAKCAASKITYGGIEDD